MRFAFRALICLILAFHVGCPFLAKDSRAASPVPLTEAQKRYLRGDDRRRAPLVEPEQEAPRYPDQDVDELIRHREEIARKMQQLRSSLDPTKDPTHLASAQGPRTFSIGDHPRMLPFVMIEVLWIIAMLLLRLWLSDFAQSRWASSLATFLVLILFVAGAGIGLPLGVFGGVYRQWFQSKFGIVI